MGNYRKLSHTVYKCEYHIVWTPKYRYKILKGVIASQIMRDIHALSTMKDVMIEELSVQEDHIHCSVPPKVSLSSSMGFLKGKLAIKIFRSYPKLKQKLYWGNHFWSRGYFVSTVGLDEELIRRYIRYQDKNDRDQDKKDSGQNILF